MYQASQLQTKYANQKSLELIEIHLCLLSSFENSIQLHIGFHVLLCLVSRSISVVCAAVGPTDMHVMRNAGVGDDAL